MQSIPPALDDSAAIAASYERVSTRSQGQTGFSLGAQAKDAAQFAAEHAWSLPEHLRFRDGEDRHASGADWDLPGLNAMLDAAKRREFTVLLVPSVDRLARDMVKAKVLEQELRKLGVRTVYISAPVDGTPEGQLLVNIQHVFAEYERSKIALRTMRGRREKVERGQVAGHGPAPYGYRYIRDGSSRPRVVGLEIDGATRPIVERIFREALHRSTREICDGLRADGVVPPTGYNRRDPSERWAVDVVGRILTHPVYAGRMVYGVGEGRQRADAAVGAVSVPVPPIVDEALWDAVQEALKRRRTVRKARLDADPWELRGMLSCGHCGGLLSTATNFGRGIGRYRQYSCLRSQPILAARAGAALCPMRDVRAEDIEAAVWAMVRDALMDPARLHAGLDAARAEHQRAETTRTERAEALDREIARQRRLIGRILDELLETPKGTESYRGLVERQRRAESLLQRLENERLSVVSVPEPGLSTAAAAELEQFAAELREGLEVAGAEDRRWVLERLRITGSVRLDPNGVIFGRRKNRYALELDAVVSIDQTPDRMRSLASHPKRWSLDLPAVLVASAGILRLRIMSGASHHEDAG